mmetsp:Transcript_21360/g.48179  ORF Transcript_21360/g.48179 Transcript_21360/m.48179 type:complete len:218 (+) Transcript_21360:341-994(+)
MAEARSLRGLNGSHSRRVEGHCDGKGETRDLVAFRVSAPARAWGGRDWHGRGVGIAPCLAVRTLIAKAHRPGHRLRGSGYFGEGLCDLMLSLDALLPHLGRVAAPLHRFGLGGLVGVLGREGGQEVGHVRRALLAALPFDGGLVALGRGREVGPPAPPHGEPRNLGIERLLPGLVAESKVLEIFPLLSLRAHVLEDGENIDSSDFRSPTRLGQSSRM